MPLDSSAKENVSEPKNRDKKVPRPAAPPRGAKRNHGRRTHHDIASGGLSSSTSSSSSCSTSSSRSSSSSSTSSSDDEDDVTLPPPPDGGWGWVVVAASFFVHLIADGCAFSFGVLYTELLEYFGESKGKTAWIGSLFVSVPLITGPVASALTNRYGCRTVTMVGALLAATGFIASSFANSTEVLCVTFGIVAGFGLSMVYVTAVVIVAFYFEKRRAFATGLAVAGSGIGTFLFAPLIEYLIDEYTWRGAVLIMGAVMLEIVICGALFRPLIPPHLKKRRKRLRRLSGRSSRLSSQSTDESRVHSATGGGVPALCINGCVVKSPFWDSEPTTHSLIQFPTYVQRPGMELVTPDLLRDLRQNGKTLHEFLAEHNLLDRFYAMQNLLGDASEWADTSPTTPATTVGGSHPSLAAPDPDRAPDPDTATSYEEDPFDAEDGDSATPLHVFDGPPPAKTGRQPKPSKPTQHAGGHLLLQPHDARPRLRKTQIVDQFQPLYRKDIFYRGNLLKAVSSFPSRSASCPDLVIHAASDSDSDRARHGVLSLLRLSKEVKHIIGKMLDISILRNGLFIYFCLSCMLLYSSYDVPYVYTVDKAVQEMGISYSWASYLVSIIGITSTVGQVAIGYIGDLPQVHTIHLYNALTSVAGVVTMFVPLLTSYAGLATYCAAFGFFISANYALTTIILVDLLGMDKLTNAYGIMMLAEGLANVIGPPLAGWLSDKTGDYNATFCVAGALMVASGVMLFAIPCLGRSYDKSRSKNSLVVVKVDADQVIVVSRSEPELSAVGQGSPREPSTV